MLVELCQVLRECNRGEGSTGVGKIFLWYDTIVLATQLISLFCLQGFSGVQMCLKLHIHMAGCVVNKQTTTRVER
jgi:hypothetical protein